MSADSPGGLQAAVKLPADLVCKAGAALLDLEMVAASRQAERLANSRDTRQHGQTPLDSSVATTTNASERLTAHDKSSIVPTIGKVVVKRHTEAEMGHRRRLRRRKR